MRYFIIALLFAPSALLFGQNQQSFSHQELTDDTRYVMELFESTHPDPYTSFGGRLAFQTFFQDVLENIPKEGLDAMAYYNRIKPFFAQLGDGHSQAYIPKEASQSSTRYYSPIKLTQTSDEIFIISARPGYEDLIGAKIRQVEGRSVKTLIDATNLLKPTENEAGSKRNLISILASNRYFDDVFHEDLDQLLYTLEKADGEVVEAFIEYKETIDVRRGGEWIEGPVYNIPESDAPFYSGFLKGDKIAYFRIKEFNGREGFEFLRTWGRNDLKDHLAKFYKSYMKEAMPKNIDEAIMQVPSMTECTYNLLKEMDAKNCHDMIIDLRDNGGGWSAMGEIMYYLLYGDSYFEKDFPITFATRLSETHLQLTDLTIDSYNHKYETNYRLGDYRIDAVGGGKSDQEKREDFFSQYDNGEYSFLPLIEKIPANKTNSPTIYVLVNGGTISAAYHAMYYLWHLGATVVGTPPAQSGNAFVDGCSWQLPNTGIKGNISRTAQIFFPDDQEMGRLFTPEISISWEIYSKYVFSQNTGIQIIAEIKGNRK